MSKPLLLCVDHETLVLNKLKIQLKKEFHNIYLYEIADSADEALELLKRLKEKSTNIVVIVSDWLMPGIKGDEFLIKSHQFCLNIIKIILTDQADESAVERAKEQASLYTCLNRSGNGKDLIKTIRSGLSKL